MLDLSSAVDQQMKKLTHRGFVEGAAGRIGCSVDCHRVGNFKSEKRTRSLELAASHEIESIAFPSISTGVYGFPIKLAAPIAVAAVRAFDFSGSSLAEVIFCCYSQEHFEIYSQLLRSRAG